jgi:hypothetical protein
MIMQIETIARFMFLGGFGFFAWHGVKYARLWWVTPCDQPVDYGLWRKWRRQTIAAALALVVSFSLPSRAEAVAQYVGYKVANASVWDRMFGDRASFEEGVDEMVRRMRK